MQEVIKKSMNPLEYRSIPRLLIMFAVPAVISMLVNAVYNIVDQIFIGQGVGYLGNAATTVSFPIVTIILSIGTLLGAGGSSYAAIKLGEKREEEATKTLCNVFILLVVAGIILTIVGLLFLDPILNIFGATPQNIDYSRTYATIILIGAPFNLVGIGLSNMARTDGAPKLAMYSMLAGAILNTILDPIYIFVFHWGVGGAAIATITSQIISTIILVRYFIKKGNMRFSKKDMKVDLNICRKVFSLGVSSCIIQISATIMQIIMNNSLVYYGAMSSVGGDVALSAMGVVSKVSMIITSICIGIGIGAQPILGFNRGANKPKRIMKTYMIAASMATFVSCVGLVLCYMFPEQILQVFGSQDVLFANFAKQCMQIYMLGIFTAGFQITATSYFQATGQPLKASILSMLRQLILLIPLILVLPTFFGVKGILYAGPIADITSGVVVACFMIYELKKLSKQIKNQELVVS
ncbi:MAG: MATE family efflux transporter [Erysipelotrichaceae bacterium]